MLISGLALMAVGGWLFVTGRQAAGVIEAGPDHKPAEPTVAANPAGIVCTDGAETWRAEGPAATFRVPVPGEKILVMCEPASSEFRAYVDGWQAFDADGAPSAGSQPGIPPAGFVTTDRGTWAALFSSPDGDITHREIAFLLPLQEVAARCQRRHACVRGQWVPQAEARAVESDPDATPTTFSISADAVSVNDAIDLAMRAQDAWRAAKQAELDRAGFVAGCA